MENSMDSGFRTPSGSSDSQGHSKVCKHGSLYTRNSVKMDYHTGNYEAKHLHKLISTDFNFNSLDIQFCYFFEKIA